MNIQHAHSYIKLEGRTFRVADIPGLTYIEKSDNGRKNHLKKQSLRKPTNQNQRNQGPPPNTKKTIGQMGIQNVSSNVADLNKSGGSNDWDTSSSEDDLEMYNIFLGGNQKLDGSDDPEFNKALDQGRPKARVDLAKEQEFHEKTENVIECTLGKDNLGPKGFPDDSDDEDMQPLD
jgi:hypothetical protein